MILAVAEQECGREQREDAKIDSALRIDLPWEGWLAVDSALARGLCLERDECL